MVTSSEPATAPAGAIDVTGWNETSRKPVAPLARPAPLVANASSFVRYLR
jgi:hypothetical protein